MKKRAKSPKATMKTAILICIYEFRNTLEDLRLKESQDAQLLTHLKSMYSNISNRLINNRISSEYY